MSRLLFWSAQTAATTDILYVSAVDDRWHHGATCGVCCILEGNRKTTEQNIFVKNCLQAHLSFQFYSKC